MATYFTADTHFGHHSIIKNARRPFLSVEEMDETIIELWNDTVTDQDVIWHLGDFARTKDIDHAKRCFRRLNGRKRLILGNHDIEFGQAVSWLTRLEWDAAPSLMDEIDVEGAHVVLFHYAMRSWPGDHKGAYHFFGHSHAKLPAYGRSRDVGVDMQDVCFQPRLFEFLLLGMAARPDGRSQDPL